MVIIALLLLAVVAFPVLSLRVHAAGETLVSTWAELQAALTNPTTTRIVLTADITVANNGVQINTAMADGLVIDGKDPITGQIHTLTEYNSNLQSNTITVSTTGTLKTMTVQNLNIVGSNHYGPFNIDDAVKGFKLVYNNVSYNGPQIGYNRYGSIEFDDCNITLGPAGTSEECAQAASVILGGNTTITSATTTDAVFWPEYNFNNTTPGGLEIKPGAVVNITSATGNTRGLLYMSVSNYTVTVGSGASFTYQGNGWNTQSTDIATITIADGTAAQPTTVNITEPYTLTTASTDLFRATNISIGNYCNVNVAGLPGSGYSGIYAGNALTIGNNSNVAVTINTAGGTGNFAGSAVYVATAATSTGLTMGANSNLTITINGNTSSASTAALYTASSAAASGIHLNGPGSVINISVTGSSAAYSVYAAAGNVYLGPNCAMTITFGGAVSNWAMYQAGNTGTFKLDQGASLLINDQTPTTSTNGGLYVAASTGLQMADGSTFKAYFSGYNNNTSTTTGAGSLVYIPNSGITTGQNCTIEVQTTGTNTAVYAGINARGINLGAGSTLSVDLNATTSTNLIYANGNVTVGAEAQLYLHTAKNVTTCQYLLDMVSGAFTVNESATVRIIAEDSTVNYPNINLNSSGATFNSPKSVLIYTSSGRQAFWSPGATINISKVQQINYWRNPVTTPPTLTSGRFAPLPTFNWRSSTNPNGGVVGSASMSGSVATGINASFTSMSAAGVVNTPALASDQTTTGPTITNAYLGGSGATRTTAISFGYLPLTAATSGSTNPGAVTGSTDPGSIVTLGAWNGSQFVPLGTPATADANGNYVIDTNNISLGPSQSYSVISSNPTSYLTTQVAVTFHKVTFDASGGQNDPSVPSPMYVVDGSTISAPANPTNGMKVFAGWFTDPQLTQAFAFDSTPITADLTLYAKWTVTTVVIDTTVLGPTGQAVTGNDYALAGIDPQKNQAFHLVFTDQQTGDVYHVIAYRDQSVSFDHLPTGHTFSVQLIVPQHYRADSIQLVNSVNGANFSASGPATGTLILANDSTLELNFQIRVVPAGFGNAEDADNLFKVSP
ncbi:MAG: InlB B-repeat-containing protein [Actinomycetia bacterium]|nr:InlB B-repeat-containing protein [Actinomycetes bacterium]